jgi:hypothetical protein
MDRRHGSFKTPAISLTLSAITTTTFSRFDVKSLLEIFEEQMKGKSAAPAAICDGVELLSIKIEPVKGREWKTVDPDTATLLIYHGNELLHAYQIFEPRERVSFVFAYDDNLKETVSLYNQRKLRVEPHAWAKAAYKMRDAAREAKKAS